jgi:uncharacterized protein YjbJ (UPF0337 family)
MDRNRITGALRQATGSVKEVVGRVIGDKKVQAEGTADKAAAKVQKAAGQAKDAARTATDD